MTTQTLTHVNGVNVDQLVATVNAIQANPDLARFQFRAENEWLGGGHTRTTVKDFYGAGQEDSSRKQAHVLDGDEPAVLLGQDAGANAVEVILHALAACLTVGFIYNAAAQGVKIDSLSFEMEGDLDLRGFLGLSKEVRPGYEGIRLSYQVKTDAPREKVLELCAYTQQTSPVLDIIRNPVPVSVTLKD